MKKITLHNKTLLKLQKRQFINGFIELILLLICNI